MTTTPNRQESAAERARELCDGFAADGSLENAVDFARLMLLYGPQLVRENEALKKELAALRLDHGLLEIHRKQTADQLLACERALQERERDLTTSRAATDKTRQEADALMSQVQRWRPIESAPKDGTPILACALYLGRSDLGAHPRAVQWSAFHPNAPGKAAWRNMFGHKEEWLTHWMPLPLPPKETR